MSLKALVVVPPLRDFYFTPHRASFIGANTLLKILQKYNIDSKLFNFPIFKKKSKSISIPKELNYLKKHIGKEMFFKDYKLFGHDFENAAQIVAGESPKIVFISCFAFGYAEDSIEFGKYLKKINPQIITAVGGAGVTVYPDYFKNSGTFDFILPGNAEDIVPIFLDQKFNIKNLQKIHSTSELIPTIKIKNKQLFSVVLSTGCPKNCEFCSNHLTQGKKFTLLNDSNLINQIKDFCDEKIHINFEDDNILFAKEHLFRLILEIRDTNKQATFSAENGLDYMLLSIDEAEFLIKNGFSQFNFSLVSKNSSILNANKRNKDFIKFENLITAISSHKIKIFTYFIAGLKNDNFKSVETLISYLQNLPTILGISPFYPVPGIKGFENREIFKNKPAYLTLGSSFYPWNSCMSTEELIQLFCKVRKINLEKGRD